MAVYTQIDDPSAHFKVQLYTGNASTQSITFDDTDTDLQPDLLWIKCRGAAENHTIVDSVRGDSTENSGYKYLQANTTSAEQAHSGNTLVDAITSDGFNIGNNDQVNIAQPFVAWAWKESATAGFDIVSYAGNATARTISHNLSAVPHLMIMKNRTNGIKWVVYHHKNTSAPETDHLQLHDTAATSDDDSTWNDTAPTSSVFSLKTSTSVNGSSADYIAYLWRSVQGFSSMGSYTGNGNADGPFVYLGFRPAWIIIKRSSTSGSNWHMHDTKRDPFNIVSADLYADASSAEDDSTDRLDILSNGIKIKNSNGAYNLSGGTYIYMAFAEAPFVNSNGVPCNAR